MDNVLRLAVAGSGKTRFLIERLNETELFAIITYTNNNYNNIRRRIIERFGYLPGNIHIFTYFSFLYGFCFRPFLLTRTDARGITFDKCPNHYASGWERYIDKHGRTYSNRLAKFIETEGLNASVAGRIGKYFDVVMIDEAQDFAAHDFNFLQRIVQADAELILVGDFYQHTFDTSRDGNVNTNLHATLEGYVARAEKLGMVVDQTSLEKSYRCSPTICDFVAENLGISIQSARIDATEIVRVDDDQRIMELFGDKAVVKLFLKDAIKYDCVSRNWGASKGENDYLDVCVVLNNETQKRLSKGELDQLNPQTRNKLYVALTRARGSVYFVEEKRLKKLIS